jgi:hypothetical protein
VGRADVTHHRLKNKNSGDIVMKRTFTGLGLIASVGLMGFTGTASGSVIITTTDVLASSQFSGPAPARRRTGKLERTFGVHPLAEKTK